jgi:hypothetical protein
MYKYILFIVLLVSFFSEVARADKLFEVVSSRVPKYQLGSLLTETPNVKRKGESFTFKTLTSRIKFQIEGHHAEFKAVKKCRLGISLVSMAGGDCKCDKNDPLCILKCYSPENVVATQNAVNANEVKPTISVEFSGFNYVLGDKSPTTNGKGDKSPTTNGKVEAINGLL